MSQYVITKATTLGVVKNCKTMGECLLFIMDIAGVVGSQTVTVTRTENGAACLIDGHKESFTITENPSNRVGRPISATKPEPKVNPNNPLRWNGRQRKDGWYGHGVRTAADPAIDLDASEEEQGDFRVVYTDVENECLTVEYLRGMRTIIKRLLESKRTHGEIYSVEVAKQKSQDLEPPRGAKALHLYENIQGTWVLVAKRYISNAQ